MAPSFVIRVNEGSTFEWTGTMKDENGLALAPTDLASLTCTLYDEDTGQIINSRNSQNVLNANNFTLSSASSANISWDSPMADNPIIDDAKETEVHIALIRWTYGTGAAFGGSKEIAIRVVNLVRVT